MDQEQRAAGCLIGGAYGDSLGAAVEFAPSDQIKARYGPAGIESLEPAFGRAGNVTDDTQMAIATAEGLAETPAGSSHNRQIIRANLWQAYRRWYASQEQSQNRRSPGQTCLEALAGDTPGAIESPINNSAGCGGIMRAHPTGLAFDNYQRAYQIGVDSAALTHGHPNGYIPAGFLGALISQLVRGQSFDQAMGYVGRYISKQDQSSKTMTGIVRTILASTDDDSFEVIDQRVGGGGGWLGHDALAIAIYAVRRAETDPLESVRLAVNHGGDSDSTGSIAGAIAGTIHGPEPFLAALRQQEVELEYAPKLGALALELVRVRSQN